MIGLGGASGWGIGLGLGAQAAAAAAGNGLLNNLVAYWPLNEAAGANDALDLHTNGLTLTQVSSPGSAAGIVYAGARTFDGSADYFTRNSETLLQTGDVDFTISAWVYLSNLTAYHRAAGKGTYTGFTREHQLMYDPDVSGWRMIYSANGINNVASNATATPSINTWHLLVGWHDSVNNVIGISLNNASAVTNATTGAPTARNGAFWIGADAGSGSFFAGRIGPVAMWKSAPGGGGILSAAQRTALYNGGAGLAYANFSL